MTSDTAKPIRHPYSIVATTSIGLTGVILLLMVLGYSQTTEWQYLALGGILIAFLGVHGVARWLLARGQPFEQVIWLIVVTKIIIAIWVPFFVTDFWLIGLVFVGATPLQIGLVAELRRMPLAAVLGLLGAAAMVAVDLLATTDRLRILAQSPEIIFITLTLLGIQLIGLAYLLWRWRLRNDAPFFVRLDLATQQALIFTVISSASISLIVGVLIVQIVSLQIQQVGSSFQTLAAINGERVGNLLERQIDALLALGRREAILQEGLEVANAAYPEAEADIAALLADRERQWGSLPENSEFVLQYRSNPQSIELSQFRGNDLLHGDILLTDRMGALIAAQGERPERFVHNGAGWWQAAWNNSQGGVFIGDLAFDSETREATIQMAVGVVNPQTNQTVGVLASTYQLRGIQRDIILGRDRTSGVVRLLTSDGVLIAGPDDDLIGEMVYTAGELDRIDATENSWSLGADIHGSPAVVAFAELTNTTRNHLVALDQLGWNLMVSDTQTNALAEVTRSTKVASLVGLLVLALVVIAATAIARVIARPIEALTRAAVAISGGDLEERAEPIGPVEMVTLAEAFNTVTTRLQVLINNLQDQVLQHSVQIEARVEQLAMLNRITLSVSSYRDLETSLEMAAQEVAFLLDTKICGIALLDSEQNELRIIAEFIREYAHASAVGLIVSPESTPAITEIRDTGRSLMVTDPQTNPLVEGLRPLLSARRIEHLLIVPLRTRGEVMGTIVVMTDRRDREFIAGEVELAETVAGQVAGVIENSRLLTEMEDAKEAAESANEAKSFFLANVSHELRTPLTSVLGFTQIIQKRLEERVFPAVVTDDPKTIRAVDKIRENMHVILSEGERLTLLINDVLDLSKIEAGRVEWQMQPLNPRELVERATAATSSLFDKKKPVQLQTELEPNLPFITGDHDRLVQVMINLLSNAVKFTDAGFVTCRIRKSADELIFSVIDTGIGIDARDQPTIFDKFTQVVGDTLTGKPRGTGLGLAISKEIVEHHGGRIWVESEPDRGSDFSFTIPLAPKNEPVEIVESDTR